MRTKARQRRKRSERKEYCDNFHHYHAYVQWRSNKLKSEGTHTHTKGTESGKVKKFMKSNNKSSFSRSAFILCRSLVLSFLGETYVSYRFYDDDDKITGQCELDVRRPKAFKSESSGVDVLDRAMHKITI
jgi:hypothetical protein